MVLVGGEEMLEIQLVETAAEALETSHYILQTRIMC